MDAFSNKGAFAAIISVTHREFASRPDSEEAVSDWMLDIMRNLTCAALANIDLSRNNISISVAEFIEKECKDNVPLQFRK